MYAASQTTVLYMKRLNQTESPIFVILCVLRQSFFTFILLYCKCSGRKKSPRIIAQVIFYFLWDHGYFEDPGYSENRIRLSRRWGEGGGGAYAASQTKVLHMNHTESPIFVILLVLCFQRLTFITVNKIYIKKIK